MDTLSVIRRGRNQTSHHRPVTTRVDRQGEVQRVKPIEPRDVVDETIAVVIDTVEDLGRLRMQRADQVWVEKRNTGIDDTNQDALLGSIDRLRFNIINVDAGGADDISDGLTGILQVPLLAEARIYGLRLRSEVRTGPGHRRLGSQNFAELVRGQRIGRTIIETDPEGRQAALKDKGVLSLDGGHLLGRDLLLVGDEDHPWLEDVRRHRDDMQQAD